MFIKFLNFFSVHLNEFVNKTGGTIESPPLEMLQDEDTPFAWRIFVEPEHFVRLDFEHYSEGLRVSFAVV